MTYNTTGTGTGTGTTTGTTIQASDIKSLIQKQGKTTINGKEFVLKSPLSTDTKLQQIINAQNFSVKSVGAPSSNGDAEYELSANGQSVKIKVNAQKTH